MAIQEPSPGELRESVRFERREVVGEGDGFGNSDGDWLPLIARRSAKLVPRTGGEQVVAERLQGVSSWDLWVRFDQATSQVEPGDRLVDRRNAARVFNIRFCQDMTGRRRWILMQLELGVAT
jgi:head-tail adaptor